MADKVNISGLDKAAVLAALYNNARPLGMGFLHARVEPMTVPEAQKLLEEGDDLTQMFGNILYFDYVHGRPLKVDISGDELSPHLYDRDQGQGACQRAIEALRKEQA